jgi:pimeloyl-ACP methyl ester carboxylesterase
LETTISSLSEGEIRLRDGRRLAYAEYGDPQGKPIFFFHGTPGSRLFHHPDTSVAASAGARIIAIDRPGFGRSDFKPGRTLLDWPSDVVQLADALNVERFAVMGYSGGGPYAAVCASSIPDRLTAAGLVSSIAPLDSPEITRGMHGMGHMFFSLERHLPPLARLSCRLMCTTWRSNPDLYFKAQLNGLYDSREAQTLLPVMKAMLTADLLEAVRDGTHGITWDLEILARPWGFQLHVIPTDVFLWHGENDTQAPVAMGKRLAGAIPHCRATFFPGEGHWAIYNHWQEILTALARAEATTRERPRPAAMPSPQDIDRSSETAILPEVLDIVDTPTDSVQGLQPARETPETAPTEETQGITTFDEEAPADASPEAKAVRETPRPVSKKTAKRRTAAKANASAAVPPEPEPVKKTAKPAFKKTAKARAAAVPAETEPEAPKPVSKKAAARPAAAIADSLTKGSGAPKLAPGKAKATAGKTAKRAAAATAGAPTDGAAKHNSGPDKAKASAKRSAKPRAAAVEPTSAAVPKESPPAPEPAEPTSAKLSSRRRAVKEAVLV